MDVIRSSSPERRPDDPPRAAKLHTCPGRGCDRGAGAPCPVYDPLFVEHRLAELRCGGRSTDRRDDRPLIQLTTGGAEEEERDR